MAYANTSPDARLIRDKIFVKWTVSPLQYPHLLKPYDSPVKRKLDVFRAGLELTGMATFLQMTAKMLAEERYGRCEKNDWDEFSGDVPQDDHFQAPAKKLNVQDFKGIVRNFEDQIKDDKGIGTRKALELKKKMLMKRCNDLEKALQGK